MNTPIFLSLLAWSASAIAAEQRPHWNNIDVIRENVEPPRAHFRVYENRAQAGRKAPSAYTRSLNGTWKFHYSDSPRGRPQDFFRQDFDDSAWADLPVPSNWERHGFGYPIYVNVPYPFEIDEPNVPEDDNPVGSYRRTFEIPEDWQGRDIFIQFGAVSSAFYLWINGQYVGYSEGSKTASEFDITGVAGPGSNTVAVEVYRWSTGSYLEDQDFWSLSGIQRDVTIEARPTARVRDYFVRPTLVNDYRDGYFDIEVDLVNSGSEAFAARIEIEVLDGDRSLFRTAGGLDLAPGGNDYSYGLLVEAVQPWSAEIPKLYTMYIDLKDGDGQPLETIRQEIGFRTSQIVNGRFLVNGQLVKLKGVNLHEHHDVTGHVVDQDTMLTDIRLMKGANMNAVRNSHYPQPERWYELVSEHGLYMVDEANIESHGYGYEHDQTLGNKPHWKDHHLDRTRRMLERSKNYPAVVIWSLGNEAGDGVNLGATYKWIKSRDLSRPVQYETEGDLEVVGERHSDFHSSMYWRHWDLEEYAQTHNDRPFVLIEYAHSMGNSTGNLEEYWDVINAHDILAGGFIWDWVDQGLREVDEEGTPYWTYGGDYGPPGVPSSGNFCDNGIVFPDRRIQPAYWEVKRAYQEVEFKALNLETGRFVVENNYDFQSLRGFQVHWKTRLNGAVISSGHADAPDVPPRASAVLTLWDNIWTAIGYWDEYDNGVPAHIPAGTRIHVDLELVSPDSRGLMEAGHAYARAQFEVTNPHFSREPLPVREAQFRLTESAEFFRLEGRQVSYQVDRASGLLSRIEVNGEDLLLAPLTPNFWRAPTDNDFGNYMGDWAGIWRDAGAKRKLMAITSGKDKDGHAFIRANFAFLDEAGSQFATWQADYTPRADSGLHIRNRFERQDGLPEIPRLGMNLELARSFDSVGWAGRGPHENYSDRNRSAHYGLWQMPVSDMYVPYMRPQENGNRTGVDQFYLFSESRDRVPRGLFFHVAADDPIEFSVHHNRMADFIPPVKIAITSEDGEGARENAGRVNIHVNDIKPRDLISVNIDHAQMGVGGDDSWGKRTLQRYMLNERKYEYGFTISVRDN